MPAWFRGQLAGRPQGCMVIATQSASLMGRDVSLGETLRTWQREQSVAHSPITTTFSCLERNPSVAAGVEPCTTGSQGFGIGPSGRRGCVERLRGTRAVLVVSLKVRLPTSMFSVLCSMHGKARKVIKEEHTLYAMHRGTDLLYW